MVQLHFRSVQAIPSKFYTQAIKNSWSPEPDSDRIARLSDVIASENTIVMVACLGDDNVLGFAIYFRPEQLLKALYVDPQASGLGIGTRLLALIEEQANAKRISLKASLNAIPFYTRAGFLKVRDTEQELSDGSRMAALEMVKALP